MYTKESFKPVGNMPEGILPDGEFRCFNEWVNKATSWIGGMNSACYDSKGRRCRIGGDFKRAEDEKCFPIYYWYGFGGQTAAQQKKSQAATKRALKLQYPWRY